MESYFKTSLAIRGIPLPYLITTQKPARRISFVGNIKFSRYEKSRWAEKFLNLLTGVI